MFDLSQSGGESTINITLSEIPQRWDDQVVFPWRGKAVLGTTWLELDGVTNKLYSGIFISSSEKQKVNSLEEEVKVQYPNQEARLKGRISVALVCLSKHLYK